MLYRVSNPNRNTFINLPSGFNDKASGVWNRSGQLMGLYNDANCKIPSVKAGAVRQPGEPGRLHRGPRELDLRSGLGPAPSAVQPPAPSARHIRRSSAVLAHGEGVDADPGVSEVSRADSTSAMTACRAFRAP